MRRKGASVTSPRAVGTPVASADAPGDESQQIREAVTALLVRWPLDREATDRLLGLLEEARRASPPPPYQYIREAYSEYASNISFAWRQVGSHLRKAMRAVEAEEAPVERG